MRVEVKHHQLVAPLRVGLVEVFDDGRRVVVVSGPSEDDIVAGKFVLKKLIQGGAPPDESVVRFGVADHAVAAALHGIIHEHGAGLLAGKIGAVEKFKFSIHLRTQDAAPSHSAFFPRHLGFQHGILGGFFQRLETVVAVFLFGDVARAEEYLAEHARRSRGQRGRGTCGGERSAREGQGGGEERGFLEKGTTGGNHVGET